MIRAVIDNAEEHSGHLAEGEVARLISVLQKAEFKRSEARNFKKDQTFKPRSLMEIAVESQRRDAEIEAAKQAEEAVAEAKRREAAKAQSDPVIDRTITDAGQIDDGQIDGTQIENSQIDKDADAPTTPGDDTGSIADDDQLAAAAAVIEPAMADATAVTGKASGEDIPAKELEGQPAANTGDTADNADTGNADTGNADTGNVDTGNTNDTLDTGEAQVASNFETVTAAFERGKAEGIAEGRAAAVAETKAAAEAAAQDKLAAAVKLFEDGLAALAKPQALQAEALSRSIQTAILKLANQRAGQQIDEMPDAFLTRIEKLVTSIGQKMAAGKVRINAEDYAAMKPHLQNAAFDFIADPIIARGDIILKFDGVELHDIAAQRISSSYSDPVTDSKQDSETVSETGVETEVAAIEPPLAETAETDSAQNEQVSKPDDKASS
jgi:flagellar biosynthesis/type III secretory pathway protein FliH